MDFNKIIIVLFILAIIASILYGFLFFSKTTLYEKIENSIIKIILRILTFIVVIVLPIIIIGLGFGVFGIISFNILFILDIVGVILVVKMLILPLMHWKNNVKMMNM